jgi:hypothetical protein
MICRVPVLCLAKQHMQCQSIAELGFASQGGRPVLVGHKCLVHTPQHWQCVQVVRVAPGYNLNRVRHRHDPWGSDPP